MGFSSLCFVMFYFHNSKRRIVHCKHNFPSPVSMFPSFSGSFPRRSCHWFRKRLYPVLLPKNARKMGSTALGELRISPFEFVRAFRISHLLFLQDVHVSNANSVVLRNTYSLTTKACKKYLAQPMNLASFSGFQNA